MQWASVQTNGDYHGDLERTAGARAGRWSRGYELSAGRDRPRLTRYGIGERRSLTQPLCAVLRRSQFGASVVRWDNECGALRV